MEIPADIMMSEASLQVNARSRNWTNSLDLLQFVPMRKIAGSEDVAVETSSDAA
jgi:hypothetical protein